MTQTERLDAIRRYRSDKGHQYAIVRLGIFGSAARNRMTGASDIYEQFRRLTKADGNS